MLLLSQDYVNMNAAKEFKLSKDLNIEYLIHMCYLNAHKFKKVSIIKDFVQPIIDYVNVSQVKDWR
jgi:hypothetical protein